MKSMIWLVCVGGLLLSAMQEVDMSSTCKADPEVEDLVKEISGLKARMSNYETLLSTFKAPHYEEGTVSCGDSVNWAPTPEGVYKYKTSTKSVTFRYPYTTLPEINIAALEVDASKDENLRYRYYLTDVTNTGFKINCRTWGESHIYGINVRWTSSVA